MTAEVGKKKKRRGGHRLYLAGILPEVDASLEHYTVERKAELAKWKHTLNEQLEKIFTDPGLNGRRRKGDRG